MAATINIPNLDRKVRRHFKKVFDKLNGDYNVREPILEDLNVAPCIIEGPCNSWVFVGYHAAEINLGDLDRLNSFNQSMNQCQLPAINYIAVVDDWQEAMLDLPSYIRPIERQKFYDSGEAFIQNQLVELPVSQFVRVKKTLFPESIIPAECSTRRQEEVSDTSARLLPFFLDYDQEQATRLDMLESVDKEEEQQDEFSVRLINGVAGSGKTLILVNRAIIYCRKFPHKNVLLVIHNTPVVEDIKHRFESWLGGKPKNLEISTFLSFAWWQHKRAFHYVKGIVTKPQVEMAKKKILNDENPSYRELSLKDDQIWEELEYISEYLIKNKEEYLSYERQGRGFALQKSQREHIWQLYQLVQENFSKREGYLPSLYIKKTALSDLELQSYDHIMIDEAQFFFPSWLELIKRSLTSGGSIFICADPNQGFLKNRLSWKNVGLNVRGRTKRLNHSYRTTYEILVAANALLEGLEANSEDYVTPDFDKMERGNKPQVVYSRNPQDEITRFLNELELLVQTEEIQLDRIMVLCSEQYKTWILKKTIEERLGSDTVINYNCKEDRKNSLGRKIKLMSINSCTGMECSTTFVLGVGEVLNQTKHIELTDAERESAKQEAMRKLYVAMTRAGQQLVVFSTEPLPDTVAPFVE